MLQKLTTEHTFTLIWHITKGCYVLLNYGIVPSMFDIMDRRSYSERYDIVS